MRQKVSQSIIGIVFGMLFSTFIILPVIYLSVPESQNHLLSTSVGLSYDQSLDDEITHLMQAGYVPSLVACIIQNDSVVWIKGYGEQASIDTVFMIASITKTFTATAILQLYEQKFFNLDDDVNDYLPFSLRNPNHPNIPITFRMLLSHTSSINGSQENYWDVTFQDLWRKMGFFNDTVTFPSYPMWLEEYFTPNGSLYSSSVWNKGKPGAGDTVAYANPGFDLLGYLIELLSNKTLEQYFTDHIFSPLNMDSTGFNFSAYKQEKLAIPYYWNDTEGNISALPHYQCLAYGAGALRTTIMDLSRYLITHMHDGYFNGTRILKRETIELMHDCTHSTQGNGYGFGWSQDYNPQWQGHNGGMPGSGTQMYLSYPRTELALPVGVIVFGNQLSNGGGEAIFLIRDKLFEKALAFKTENDYSTTSSSTKVSTPGFTTLLSLYGFSLTIIVVLNRRRKRNLGNK